MSGGRYKNTKELVIKINELKRAEDNIDAYAKINLYLKINSMLDDGYHELETVMSRVSLCDRIFVSITGEATEKLSVSMSSNSRMFPINEKNTVYKAAYLFFKAAGAEKFPRMNIYVKKRIPVQAGLGGGSADAAGVLVMLNKLFEYPLPECELLKIGLEVGADVPFCIKGGTALCRGKGEIITPFKMYAENFYVVLCKSCEHVSTKAAFDLYDEATKEEKNSGDCRKIVSCLKINPYRAFKNMMFNDFESVILESCPSAKMIKNIMMEKYAIGSLLTGSGSCVYGIFKSKNAAYACSKYLCAQSYVDFCGVYKFI